jgi:hypothetical protein
MAWSFPLNARAFYDSGAVTMRTALFALACAAMGCAQVDPPSPFAQAEEKVWRTVNRSATGRDGIFVQATLRSFAYEIASFYANAEREGLDQEQLESRLSQFVYGYVDSDYPMEDGTDINSLYLQYLIYLNPSFDPSNPLQKRVFNVWRGDYVQRLVRRIYDVKFPLLRHQYDERWGVTLYSRLVFDVYLDNQESELRPNIDDIGSRTFLQDDEGNRYSPSGLAGPYPHEFYRPRNRILKKNAVYRLHFPNRKADRQTPIVGPETKYMELVIVGLGEEPERTVRWELPLEYAEVVSKRLDPAAGRQQGDTPFRRVPAVASPAGSG